LTLEFKNVPALWDVDIVNNEGNSVKSVRVIVDPDGTTATDMPFVTEATIDLKKDYSTTPLRVTPVTYAASVSTTFAAVQTAPTFKATLFLLPATISGDLKIMVTLDDDTNLRFPLDGFNQEFASGTRFTSSIDLEDAEDDDPEPPEPDPDFEVSYDGVLTAYRGAGGDIRLPDNVTAVMDGNNALGTGIFQNNTTVTSIDLNNVVTLGINAFKGATGIVTVNAPNLEVIKAEGFHAAPNLVTVNSPKLKSIGDHCFQSCEALKTIDVSQVVELTGTNGGQRIFRLCKSLESIDMASFEGTIPFQMFIGCEKLVNVNLPKATAIGGTDDAGANRGQVFADCNLLTELSFPEATILSWRSVNALITRLSVPKVTTLRNQALAYCTELTYISLPSVTEIATNQFQGPSPAPIVIDFSEATGLTTVAANAFPDIAGIEIYVATEAIKALFLPAPTNTTITVGAPPPQP
jgi:hypothetical protein